jgi:ATP-binding cassette, subfamily B, multidrug efflux pump
MKFQKKYIKKYWKSFCIAITFLVIEAICDLMMPTIMARIIDIGVANKNMDYVLNMGAVMLGVTAIGAVGAVGRNIVSSNVSQTFGAELRGDIFKKIQSFSFDNINEFETASLMTRQINDVSQLQHFVHGAMRVFLKAPILCIGSLVMATLLDPPMALVPAVVVPVVGILIMINVKVGYPFFKKVQKLLDRVNGVIREYLSGVRVVKAFNRFDYEVNRFDNTNQEFADVSIKAARLMSIFTPGITLTVNIGIVAVLWFGGIRVNNGNMQVGQVIAFINYMTQILSSIMIITFVFSMFTRARASYERIQEVFDKENNMKVGTRTVESSTIKGRIDFENVTFSYKNTSGDPVIKNVTFKCEPKETVGIIGSTGSGKSSLVNLIPRFYDVTSGIVKVNGVDVKEIDTKNLREKIAIVPQKTILFTGTILENIRWGKDDATMDEVEDAAKVAQAHDFITSFPEKYDTILGQGGVNLSGGQKQRVAIARALIRRPEILILDDSTSAVDVATEGRIREGLKKYIVDLTCIIIAQRITSVMDADRIIVLDNGEIVGEGTHKELMETCEVYQDIFYSQIGKEGM